MFKKYLIYSKRFIRPKLSEIDQNKITQFYADIRRESNLVGGIPIAVRHIESVIRMSEAWAKMHLRDYVRSDDIDNAIEMLLESFLMSQKVSVARQLTKKFEKYRARQQDSSQLLLHTLRKVVTDRVSIPYTIFISDHSFYYRPTTTKFSKVLIHSPRSVFRFQRACSNQKQEISPNIILLTSTRVKASLKNIR